MMYMDEVDYIYFIYTFQASFRPDYRTEKTLANFVGDLWGVKMRVIHPY